MGFLDFFKKKEEVPVNLDAELNKLCDEVAPTIKPEEPKKEEEKKKTYKVMLRVYFKKGNSVDYWFNNVENVGHNGRQWFKGFFRWWFHRPEEHSYYQEVNKGGMVYIRKKISHFEVKVEEENAGK